MGHEAAPVCLAGVAYGAATNHSSDRKERILADTLGQIRELLESRLAELRAEEKRLSEALKQLGGEGGRTDGGTSARKPRRRRRARRAARGQRREELLKLIKAMPGAPVSEIADEMDISPGQVNGLLSKARAEKLIVKEGRGFAVK